MSQHTQRQGPLVSSCQQLYSCVKKASSEQHTPLTCARPTHPAKPSFRISRISRQKSKNEFLAGCLPLYAFLNMLIDKNVTHKLLRDDSGKLSQFFISTDSSVAIAKDNSAHDVHLLNSTFKNNKYRMPLQHIMSEKATNQSFSLAYGSWVRRRRMIICGRLRN